VGCLCVSCVLDTEAVLSPEQGLTFLLYYYAVLLFAVRAITPVATHFFVAWSVICLFVCCLSRL